MKVLYHHRVASKDGQDVHVQELVAALRRRGHEIIIVGPPLSRGTAFGSGGGGVALLRRVLPRWLAEALEFAYSVPAYWRLRQAWRQHRPDLLYERYTLYLLSGVWLKASTGIPMLLEVNSPLARERADHGGLGLPQLAAWCERKTWQAADVALPVTEVLAGHLRAAGVAGERIRVVPNGVDSACFSPLADGPALRRELGLEGKLVLGFTGFLRAWHGLSMALDLLAARPELHLLVAGDGPARAQLLSQADQLGVRGRLTILGVVPRDRIGGVIAAFDIALQPKAVDYASPLKLFEYMTQGRAIVAPNQPNIREVLTDGEDALLFAPGDQAAFAAAVNRLCDAPELRRRLGDGAAQRIATAGYSWDRNAARIEALAGGLLARSGNVLESPSYPLCKP